MRVNGTMACLSRVLRIALAATLLSGLCLAALPAAGVLGASWYDTGWQYRKTVTVNATCVAATMTDFPVLVLTSADADLAANAQDDADDILFTAADGVTKLSHEIEKFDGATGEMVAWVKLPFLSDTANTILYLYYGNASAASQQSPAAVWSNGYEAVYHLTDSVADSLGAHDGVDNGTVNTVGRVAFGRDVTPAADIRAGSWNVTGSSLSVQAWVNPDDFNQDDPRMVSKAGGSSEQDHVFMLGLGGSGEKYLRARLKTGTSDCSGTTTLVASSSALSTGNWYLASFVYDGAAMRLYRDGVQVAATAKNGAIRENCWEITFGDNPDNTDTSWASLDGKLDEIRISSVTRSADWQLTEYANQSSPSTFLSFGTAESAPTTTPTSTPPASVGGVVFPNDTWAILAPWLVLGLAALFLAGGGTLLAVRRRR